MPVKSEVQAWNGMWVAKITSTMLDLPESVVVLIGFKIDQDGELSEVSSEDVKGLEPNKAPLQYYGFLPVVRLTKTTDPNHTDKYAPVSWKTEPYLGRRYSSVALHIRALQFGMRVALQLEHDYPSDR